MNEATKRKMEEIASQVDISKTEVVTCESCDGKTFKQTLMLRTVSSIMSPTGQEVLIPVAVFACESCGHVNSNLVDAEF